MNKKIKILSLLSLLVLVGCGGTEGPGEFVCDDGQYRVQVNKPDGSYLPGGFSVQWCSANTGNCYPAQADKYGRATLDLADDDYSIHVLNLPAEYSYDPGAYVATASNKCITVNLSDVLSPTINEKTDIDGTLIPEGTPYNPYIVKEGVYKANIKTADERVYYGFRPIKPGSYVIESWSDEIWVNGEGPSIKYYGNNNDFINEESPVIQDENSGYDKNFKIQLDIGIDEFETILNDKGEIEHIRDNNGNYIPGGSYVFSIGASVNRLAKDVPFVIKRIGDYVVEKVIAEEVEVTANLSQFPEKLANDVYKDALIDGTFNVYYNENDGFYHYRRKTGPVLVAKISAPNKYFGKESFATIQDAGNKSLTLDNGKYDYTKFIETYAEFCNSDGVYGVTEELKTFLELFYESISEWFNSESNINKPDTIVDEASAWLFACGYYIDIADSYDKPVAGDGTLDNPYEIRLGKSYYVELEAGNSQYYTFFNQNREEEKLYWLKSTSPNACFVINGDTYTSSDGPSVIIPLGGLGNDSVCTVEIKSADGNAAKFVVELVQREKTVAGDKIDLGTNTLEVFAMTPVNCSYTASRAGTYSFLCGEENAWIIDSNGNNYQGSNGPISFSVDLEIGETFTFQVYTLNLEYDFITFTLTYETYASVGVNLVTFTKEWEEVEYKFIAKDAGTYKIECSTPNVAIFYNNEWRFNDSPTNSFSVVLNADQVITFRVATADHLPGSVGFTITKLGSLKKNGV